jgi:hypothetical protein
MSALRKMKMSCVLLISLGVFVLLTWTDVSSVLAGQARPVLLKDKQEAEARGYLFVASHEEIVAGAKKEGRLRALSNLDRAAIKAMSEAFKKKYPFIDVHAEEIGGTEAFQRLLLEIKSGPTRNWDANSVSVDSYNEFLPHQKKFDILGMAEHGVINIPTTMIDPIHRNIVALSSAITSVAYNKSLIPPERVPGSWEGFLGAELKGKKYLLDVRPTEIARLVPAWAWKRLWNLHGNWQPNSPSGCAEELERSRPWRPESTVFSLDPGYTLSSEPRLKIQPETWSISSLSQFRLGSATRTASWPRPIILTRRFCGWNFR